MDLGTLVTVVLGSGALFSFLTTVVVKLLDTSSAKNKNDIDALRQIIGQQGETIKILTDNDRNLREQQMLQHDESKKRIVDLEVKIGILSAELQKSRLELVNESDMRKKLEIENAMLMELNRKQKARIEQLERRIEQLEKNIK